MFRGGTSVLLQRNSTDQKASRVGPAGLEWKPDMQQDKERFLSLKAAPGWLGRLTAEQAAWFLGFSAHEIPVLANRGLLKPSGHPAHNGQKHFLAATLEELRVTKNGSPRLVMQWWNTGETIQPERPEPAGDAAAIAGWCRGLRADSGGELTP
jgi:hypothetical protein